MNENRNISIKIPLKFVPKGPTNNILVVVQMTAWRRSGDNPLSEPKVYWRIYVSLGLNELKYVDDEYIVVLFIILFIYINIHTHIDMYIYIFIYISAPWGRSSMTLVLWHFLLQKYPITSWETTGSMLIILVLAIEVLYCHTRLLSNGSNCVSTLSFLSTYRYMISCV